VDIHNLLYLQHCRLDSTDAGMWPPHAFPLLLVYFLQQLREPVLPVLHELVDAPNGENEPSIYLGEYSLHVYIINLDSF
jgi:hypothetical protein